MSTMTMSETHRRMNSLHDKHRRRFQPRVAITDPRVGFLSCSYMLSGGTETFHWTLLPRLRDRVNVIGFVATSLSGGDGGLLQVPYATGLRAARELAENSDILVTWGIACLRDIVPTNRPKIINVHHSDWSSEWSNSLALGQLDVVDEIVCVNEDVANRLRATSGNPTH